MAQRENLKTSWIYSLRKEELVNYLKQCDQDPSGTVEEMRRRLAKLAAADTGEKIMAKFLDWQRLHEQTGPNSPMVSLTIPAEKCEGVKPLDRCEEEKTNPSECTTEGRAGNSLATLLREERIATIELVRKWGLKYDGGRDVLKFLDRLEELASMYELDLSGVVPVMFELLRNQALVWFRNNHKSWKTWHHFRKDFLDFFLPPRYFEKLEEEIRKRTQRSRENFKEYVLALQDLMYHSRLTAEEKLEIIFRNALPDYQWYIKRRDFNTLEDLLSLAAELESIPTTTPPSRNERHHMLRDRSSPIAVGVSQPATSGRPQTCLLWEEEKLKAKILLDKQPSTALVDTGATRSFVMPSFIQQRRIKPEALPTPVEVALADGSKKQIKTSITAPVTLGNVTKSHEFLIMEEATEAIILGLDFLQNFDTTIQCAGLSVKSKTRTVAPRMKVRELVSLNYPKGPISFCRKMSESELKRQISIFLETELPRFQEIKGLSTIATHRIVMKDERPIKIRYAPRNPAMQSIIDDEVNSLLARGCIEPSHSPYSFPITLVRKKNGTWRTCMDFRQLNARSVPDAYPLPRINTILDRLRNAKYISSLDLKDGYWQIPMDEDSKKYTAFAVSGRGLYQWRVMPFGLHSAPATFQRALDSVIGPDMEPHAFAYLDDIIVIGKSFEEHVTNLREVFRRLRAANLKINVEKCEFFKSETRYLGHIVTNEGIKTDPEKIAAIKQIPAPQDTKGVRRFLGITSWYRRFVPNFAQLSQPLTQLLKKGKHWTWGQKQKEAFEALKDCLTKAPILACPDFSRPFALQTDASECGLGAVLTQEVDGSEHVIAYASRHLNAAERNYSATEKECLAIVWGIRKMRPYLEGYEFQVITDHLSLKWLNSIDNPTGRLARWALELQQYQFSISYRKGKQNVVADALSRQPVAEINLAQTKPPNSCPWYEKQLAAVNKSPEQHSDYAVVNNQLYRHQAPGLKDDYSTPWKLCVPTELRRQVLSETHDSVPGGHLGIRKTLHKVASRYYWPGMSRDVTQYVRQCESCQRYKVVQQQPAGQMLTRIQDEPWALVGADFIGPLPRTSHGNTMILVFFDSFSKWVELIPLRKATAEGVIKALRERIVSRYGVPKGLITDNGTQFTSRILQKYLKEIGVRHQFTAPYTPQENPTERANRTIKTILAQFVRNRHNRWDELLPEVMLAINTSDSESTGYSPAFLTQGRSPRLPRALYDELTVGSGARHLGPEERAEELKEVFQIVKRNLAKASQKQKTHYNLRRRSWRPEIGSQVLVRQHPLSRAIDNFTAKLAPKFGGPYIVEDFVSPVIVQIRAVETSERRTAHLSELKPYLTNNKLLSLLPFRYTKHEVTRTGERMESSDDKFERSTQQFRHRMKNLQQSQRRTIFLQEDDVPSTSKRGVREKKKKRVSQTTPEKPTAPRTTTARHFRMTVGTPGVHPGTQQQENPVEPSRLPEYQQCMESIDLSSDDEIPPPPPPYTDPTVMEENISEEVDAVVTPAPPAWIDDGFTLDDLAISPEDLNDPLIIEFVRSFCGATDSTVDTRPPTPPSPAKSFSSVDWENENFRPPTPPRVRRFATFDIKDAQYQYAGMHCYERVWRARVLVPMTRPTLAIAGSKQEYSRRARENSPLHRPPPINPTTPTTPGRGWLNHTGIYANKSPDDHEDTTPSTPTELHRRRIRTSPLSPAMLAPRRTPTPPPPSLRATQVEAECKV